MSVFESFSIGNIEPFLVEMLWKALRITSTFVFVSKHAIVFLIAFTWLFHLGGNTPIGCRRICNHAVSDKARSWNWKCQTQDQFVKCLKWKYDLLDGSVKMQMTSFGDLPITIDHKPICFSFPKKCVFFSLRISFYLKFHI